MNRMDKLANIIVAVYMFLCFAVMVILTVAGMIMEV